MNDNDTPASVGCGMLGTLLLIILVPLLLIALGGILAPLP